MNGVILLFRMQSHRYIIVQEFVVPRSTPMTKGKRNYPLPECMNLCNEVAIQSPPLRGEKG